MQTIFINEDNLLRWDAAALASTGAYANTATGTWTLKTAAAATLATGTMSYVAASNGRYHATIEKTDTASLLAGTIYYLELALAQAGVDGFRRIPVKARYRQGEAA